MIESSIESDKPGVKRTPEISYLELKKSMDVFFPGYDKKLIEKAYKFAADYHKGQVRKSGEEYITHPLDVATIATTLKLDIYSIIAAILHDTVEDTECTLQNIENTFGAEVGMLVDGLTKINKIKFRSNKEKLAENFRKMIVAMGKDLRVILIKLCDRLHNMRTINHMPSEKRKRISQETLDIYAPLANRLGVYSVKSELEDHCLRHLKEEVYKDLREKIAKKKSEREIYIQEVIEILERELKKYGFKKINVTGRPKHFYSIYKKMVNRHLNFDDIHDLFAFRIIVDSIKDCYEALGVVHAMWKPMPGRFKDYIAIPKPNLYQSLHTTVVRPNGEPAEIQIRTREMHQTCEFGVAAHWVYKDGSVARPSQGTDIEKFSWLRQIMQWQSELKDPEEFLEAVKVDLFDEEIFVFTPKGDVFTLPVNSTALDFAFAVHTDVGLKTTGAKINGRIVPIKKSLRSGDMVEILTQNNQKPNKDWLSFVVTSKARNKIRSILRVEERDKCKNLGKNLFNNEWNKQHPEGESLDKKEDIKKILKTSKESSLDDVFVSIGYGRLDAKDILQKSFPKLLNLKKKDLENIVLNRKPPKDEPNKSSSGILVSGFNDVLVRIGKCCSPVPGEDLVGFITRGRQISVHRVECQKAIDFDPIRKIEVSWEQSERELGYHRCYLTVLSFDKPGLLADVTNAISRNGANVYKAEVDTRPNLTGVLDFELGVHNLNQLETVISNLEKISSVISVKRKKPQKKTRRIRKRGIH